MGRQVPYVTVENPRRKSISIYWTGRIEVRCPPGTTKRRVEARAQGACRLGARTLAR